jgi:hypothetical protein
VKKVKVRDWPPQLPHGLNSIFTTSAPKANDVLQQDKVKCMRRNPTDCTLHKII